MRLFFVWRSRTVTLSCYLLCHDFSFMPSSLKRNILYRLLRRGPSPQFFPLSPGFSSLFLALLFFGFARLIYDRCFDDLVPSNRFPSVRFSPPRGQRELEKSSPFSSLLLRFFFFLFRCDSVTPVPTFLNIPTDSLAADLLMRTSSTPRLCSAAPFPSFAVAAFFPNDSSSCDRQRRLSLTLLPPRSAGS